MTLSSRTVSGIKWTSVSQFGRQIVQWGTTLVLVRLLSPSDFGLVGMAIVITGFVTLFKDLGTSAAVIQKKDISEETLSSIFWLNAGIGFLAMLIIWSLSFCIGLFYHEPRVVPILRVLCLTFFFSGLGVVHQSLFEKKLAFNRLALFEIVSTLAGAIVAIGFALKGYSVWSLVYQTLVSTIMMTSLLWLFSSWKPRWIFARQHMSMIRDFSLNLTGFNLFSYLARNMDNFLIGRFLGAEALGYYALAYRIMFYPIQSVYSVVGRVLLPLYSEIQDDLERFRRVYLKIAHTIAMITFPAMIALMVLARPLVLAVFGPRWTPMIGLLMILAPVGLIQSIGTTVGIIYQAKGRTDWLFRWGLFAGIVTIFAFILGLNWGVLGVATAYTTVSFLLAIPSFLIPFKLIHLSFLDLLKELAFPFLNSLLMMGAIFLIRMILPSTLSSLWILIILVLGGSLVYVFASYRMDRKGWQEIIKLIHFKKSQGR